MSWINKPPSDAFTNALRSLIAEVVEEYLSGRQVGGELPKLEVNNNKELININDVKAFKKPRVAAKPRASRAKKPVVEAKATEAKSQDVSPNVSDN
jgi:hypothetical protein